MSNLPAVQNAELISFDDKKLQLIKSTVARDLTDNEFEFFIAVARQRGLDPILNQIHAVVRGSGDKAKMTIQVAIDGFRLIASRTGDFAGIDAPKFLYDKDGNPTRCQVTVYRIVQNQRCAFVATAKWDEFVPEGNQGFMWKKMPEVMLAKVTEAQALRKAFPADLSGLYEDSEMHQADRDVTPPPNNQPPKQSIPQVAPKAAPTQAVQARTTRPAQTRQPDVRGLTGAGDFLITKGKKAWVEPKNLTIREVVDKIGLPQFLHDVDWLVTKSTIKHFKEIEDLASYAKQFEQELHSNHTTKEEVEEFKQRLEADDFDFNFPKGAAK